MVCAMVVSLCFCWSRGHTAIVNIAISVINANGKVGSLDALMMVGKHSAEIAPIKSVHTHVPSCGRANTALLSDCGIFLLATQRMSV